MMVDYFQAEMNAGGGLPDPEADRQFYAGVPAKRFVAWVIDVVIVWGLVFGAVLLTLGLGVFILGLLLAVVDFTYRVLTLTDRSATFGMRLMGIELRSFDGERFSIGHAIIHTLLFYAMLIFVVVQLASVLLMAGSRYGRGLHDILVGTTMINRPA